MSHWLLRMFGISGPIGQRHMPADFSRILEVFDRQRDVAVLPALIHAVKAGPATAVLGSSAIVLDTNAILRIPSHRKSSDIIDYIGGVHQKPVIIPAQTIQEFWNNQLNAINTVYRTIASKATDLEREITKAGTLGVTSLEGIEAAVDVFRERNEHLFDQNIVQKISSFLERIQSSALVPHAPRSGLQAVAAQRRLAKTPPGFKDDGDGDFLVWVDALWGLLKAKSDGAAFESVILLTNDKKIDWCRGFTAHPILYAEIHALLEVHFEVWTLDHFVEMIS